MSFKATVSTIQGTLNWALAFILNRPSIGVGGTYQEPAITSANLIMSTILSPPFAWQWNRNVNSTVTTTAGITDYTIQLPDFGWLEKATVTYQTPPASGPDTIELQIAHLLAVETFQGQGWKISVVNDDDAGNITFRLLPAPDQAYTLNLIYQRAPVFVTSLYGASLGGGISSVANASGGTTVYTTNSTISGYANLVGTYLWVSGNSLNGVTSLANPNNGLYYCTASTSTTVTLQNPNGTSAGTGGFIASATTWAPIPDKYNFLYERGMLAHLHAMYDTATYIAELQLFFRQLVGCSEGLTDTEKAIFLTEKLEQLSTQAAAQYGSTGTIRKGIIEGGR